ncbi:hypothetical protein CCACVL1_23522 [Corchorus capsularis]|uniref:Uncharacterized protein n=1 Tax=Corchorus capsularis TaxID=210143 RepID=A0A1R3GTH8_COCAP|nr:hypothetical protein CCACVL1_23522 [Corchorus capsularis]
MAVWRPKKAASKQRRKSDMSRREPTKDPASKLVEKDDFSHATPDRSYRDMVCPIAT